MIIDSLCQTYHWTLSSALSATMPQIIMMGHASAVNGKRMENRTKSKTDGEDEVTFRGKPLNTLNTDELISYYSDGG